MNLNIFYNSLSILCAILVLNLEKSKATSVNDDFYIAGVLEYNFIESKKPSDETTNLNLREYLKFIDLAKTKDVDILVFPEATLNYQFYGRRENLLQDAVSAPDPKLQIAPYQYSSNYDNLLVELSEAAKKNQMYVLVNLLEKVPCSSERDACKPPLNVHDDGFSLYNTNIVFDRQGRIISKYRKVNLYYEPSLDEPLEQPLPVFQTDFGVKFGHFICFDVLFKYPARVLVQQENITNILYPTYWFDVLPFFLAETIHQGWAYSNNVNFLTSRVNATEIGRRGSGMYFGRKRMQVLDTPTKEPGKLYTSKVPKNIRSNYKFDEPITKEDKTAPDSLNLKVIQNWMDSNPKIYPLDSAPKTVCVNDNKLCCTVEINKRDVSVSPESHFYRYALTVDYINKLYTEKYNLSEISCAIISCTDETLASCAQRFYDTDVIRKTKFEHIKITARIRSDSFDDIMILPVTITTGLLPFNIEDYKWSTVDAHDEGSGKYQIYTMESSGDIPDFLSYGIYGRDFSLDQGRMKDLERFYSRHDCDKDLCKLKKEN